MASYKKLIGASLVAIAIIVIFMLALPLYNASKAGREEIDIRQAELERRKKFVARVLDLQKQTEARQDDLSKLGLLLPKRKNAQDLLINIENMAQTAGVQVSIFKTSTTFGGDVEYEVMGAELTAEGTYTAVVDFIKLIEKNLRVIDIQEFLINKKENTDGTSTGDALMITMKITAYFVK